MGAYGVPGFMARSLPSEFSVINPGRLITPREVVAWLAFAALLVWLVVAGFLSFGPAG
jgi:hypothetical protein